MKASFSTALLLLSLAPCAAAQLQFSAPDNRAMPFTVPGEPTQSMFEVAQVNADGLPDLVIGRSGPTPEIWIGLGDVAGNFTWSQAVGVTGEDVHVFDYNGDAFADLITTYGPGHPRHSEVDFWLNDPYAPGTFPTSPTETRSFPTGVQGLAQGDIEGDGIYELFVCRGVTDVYHVWYLSPTEVQFSFITTIPTAGGEGERAIIVDDFTHDGFPEVWVGSEIWINDAAFGFTLSSTPLPNAGVRLGAATGDIDGDNRPDAVTCQAAPTGADPGLRIWPSMSACGFGGPAAFHPAEDRHQGEEIGFVEFAHLVGEPGSLREELLYQVAATKELRVYESTLDGELPATSVLLDGNCVAARVVDLNFDGLYDVVGARDTAANEYFVLWNQSAFEYEQPSEVLAESTWLGYQHIYVDRSLPLSGLVTRDGSRHRPYRSIWKALREANGGEAIFVYPGRYSCTNRLWAETAVLNVNDVELIAVCGPEHTFIDNTRVVLTNARLSGFTFRTDGADLATPGALVTSVDSTVVNNRFFCDAPTDGVLVQGTGTSRLGSNVVHGAATGFSIDAATNPSVELYNNTVVENDTGIRLAGTGAFTVVNNLVVDNTTYGVAHECSVPSALAVDYNLVTDNGTDYATIASGGCTPVLAAGPNDVDGASWDSAVQFVDVANRDFRLAGSIAVDGGDPTILAPLWLGTDVEGDPRSMGGPISTLTLRPDVGADEVQYIPELRLQVLPTPNSVEFVTTGVPVGWQEYKLLGFAPGNFPLPLANFGSNLLFDLYVDTIVGAPDAFGESRITLSLSSSIPEGTRYYVQAVAVDLFGPDPQLYPTNEATFTMQ